MLRIVQLLHLFLIVAVVAMYSWLMIVLPAEDGWRVRLSAGVALTMSVWGALLFIEALRTGVNKGLRERGLEAYRLLLSRTATLYLSTAVLGAVAGWLFVVAAGYGEIEFSSEADQDVSVFLSDPGKDPKRLALIPAGKRIAVRLPIGHRWIYFATEKGTGFPYRTGRIDVLPSWRSHGPQRIKVPEVPKYVDK